jgi:transcription elongation factor Elf1
MKKKKKKERKKERKEKKRKKTENFECLHCHVKATQQSMTMFLVVMLKLLRAQITVTTIIAL